MSPNREISMAPACVMLSLGLWTSISAPVPCVSGVPLGLVHMKVVEMLPKVVLRGRGASVVPPAHVLDTPDGF